jgi:uncharacterized membrane protein
VGTAAALVAACELIFLRDVFAGGANGPLGDAFRMNTVFKLYYQTWLIAGVASGPALALLLRAAWASVEPLFPARVSVPATKPAAATSPAAPLAVGVVENHPRSHDERDEGTPVAAEPREGTQAAAGHVTVARRASGSTPETSRVSPVSRQAHHRVSPLRYAGAGGIVVWMALLALLAAAAFVYPMMASAARTQNFALPRSLDGTAFMATDATNVGDAAAIAWLNAHIAGDPVIVEAAKYDEYTHLARVSAFTGLPTLMGWGGHELQWRINWLAEPGRGDVLGGRLDAVTQIYTNPDETTVKQLLRQYSVRLIYVGAAERQTYPSANLDRFAAFLPIIYQREGVTIYAVSEGSNP